jgi:hypothetical protein
MIIPALVGGVFLGVTSALPILNLLNCACCILLVGGGFLAAFIYLKDYPSHLPPVTYGDAAVLGMVTGVLGGFIETIVQIPLTFLNLQWARQLGDVKEIEEALSNPDVPPFVRDLALQILAEGGVTFIGTFFSLLINVLFAVVFAAIGAIIGVALLQKRSTTDYAERPPAPPTP